MRISACVVIICVARTRTSTWFSTRRDRLTRPRRRRYQLISATTATVPGNVADGGDRCRKAMSPQHGTVGISHAHYMKPLAEPEFQ